MQGSLLFDDAELPAEASRTEPAAASPIGVDLSLLPFSPRDYQATGIRKAFELFDAGAEGAIFRQPTGSGKTVSGSAIALLWLKRDERNRVIILCHERQLVGQFAEEVESFTGVRPGIEMADSVVSAKYIPEIIVASRQTLLERTIGGKAGAIAAANAALPEGCEFDPDVCDELPCDPSPDLEPQKVSRLYKFDAERFNWLVIFDECHRYAYKLKSVRHIVDWFARNNASRRLGLTATPERGDKTSLSRLFPEIASDYRLYDVDGGPCAVTDGWAVPYDQRFVTVHGVDFKTLREVSGDFDEGQLEELLTERKNLLSMIRPTLDIVGDRRTIVFNPTVGMAKMVAHTINEFGRYKCKSCEWLQWEHVDDIAKAAVPCKKCGGELEEIAGGLLARSLDGSYPDHARKDCYAQFAAANFQFLSVCGLCREGFNDPGIGAVAIYRPTKSRSLAEQMKGRGCRPLKGLVDKFPTAEERRAAIAASPKPTCIIVDLVGVTGMADCASTAHILAEGKPDDVIELANKRALEKSDAGESVDIGEEIKAAEAEIEAEKRRKREDDEEKSREELRAKQEAERIAAERMRKLRGEVDYSERQVDPGGGGAVEGKRERAARMPFGKHVGKAVSELPGGYMRALIENKTKMPPWLRDAIKGELSRRESNRQQPSQPKPTMPASPAFDGNSPCTPQQARVLAKYGKPTDVTASDAVRMIGEINQQLKSKSLQPST